MKRDAKILLVVCALAVIPLPGYFLVDRLVGNVPIVFYGQVVDQDGRPAPETAVRIAWQRNLILWVPIPMGPPPYEILWQDLITDAQGKFEVRPGRGTFLRINKVSKSGYYWADDKAHFRYSNGHRGALILPLHRPDPEHPVHLTIKKPPVVRTELIDQPH